MELGLNLIKEVIFGFFLDFESGLIKNRSRS